MKSNIFHSDQNLPGRDEAIVISDRHFVNGASITPPFPEGSHQAIFGLGCFWGAERCFWKLDGVISTAVGYAGGSTKNPTYHEVCSGMTGHTEAVLVIY
ncbi:peptide-methionine (S)-S-oxide reductase, partial [Gammaproteobacteria bacterium]|nr:peptide-methionine (S)-S-oxide reductase [Gammaproteobacteria bacterium]